MKKTIFLIILFSLLLTPMFQAAAQNLSVTESSVATGTTGFPQWVRDMRRWEIVAFGTFPFSLFITSFTMDMIRWNNANGMNFSAEGRRYAPWPFRSAGAVEMTNDEFRRTLFIAAGLSITVALVDMFIVRTKRNNELRRLESMPSGVVEIDRRPIETPPIETPPVEIFPEEESGDTDAAEE
jgi:hypothetical protein